jgi:tetratricopeptide (TPR) repeat protein
MNSYKNTAVGFLLVLCLTPSLVWASQDVPADYQAAVEKIVDGINARDPEPFSQAIDADRLLDAALSGLFVDPESKSDFARGLRIGLSSQRVVKQMIQRMPEGGYAKLLRVKMDGDIAKALMRVDFGDYGNGYMDIHLSQAINGKIKVVDWFDYSTGLLYSEGLRQLAASVLPTPTVLGKVFDVASNRKENADILVEFMRMYGRGEYEQATRKFLTLDEDLRKSRLLNIIAFKLANLSNDMELYREVLINIERNFSTDESMSFILVDYYWLEGDYDKVLRTADRLLSTFGVEDAGIAVIKANALVEKGEAQEAMAQAKRAIELEPEYEFAYIALLNAQVLQKQYAQAVGTGDILEKRFYYDYGPESLAGEEFFAGFVESAEYRKWRSGKE